MIYDCREYIQLWNKRVLSFFLKSQFGFSSLYNSSIQKNMEPKTNWFYVSFSSSSNWAHWWFGRVHSKQFTSPFSFWLHCRICLRFASTLLVRTSGGQPEKSIMTFQPNGGGIKCKETLKVTLCNMWHVTDVHQWKNSALFWTLNNLCLWRTSSWSRNTVEL